MIRWIAVTIFLTGLFTACVAQTGGATAPEPAAKPHRKIMLMHYMPWYETPEFSGKWGAHWTGHDKSHHPENTDANGLPDIWSKFHPLIGLYDSSDPAVLECQLLQMKLAGVDGVIVDWYGIGPIWDHPSIHKATKAMFAATAATGMKFAACYEDRTLQGMVDTGHLEDSEVTTHLTDTFRWMESEWFSKSNYFRLRGRPLVLNFGPMFVKDATQWDTARNALTDRPLLYPLHHLWKNANGDGLFTWVHQNCWFDAASPAEVAERLKKEYYYRSTNPDEVIPSAYPGFVSVYPGHWELPHNNGETLRTSLGVCMEEPWPVMQLVTWNDYGEGTTFEPSHENGYKYLEIVQEARRKELGGRFPFTADDLRLPARLLALRRTQAAPKAELDRIAGLLADGKCAAARTSLNTIEARVKNSPNS